MPLGKRSFRPLRVSEEKEEEWEVTEKYMEDDPKGRRASTSTSKRARPSYKEVGESDGPVDSEDETSAARPKKLRRGAQHPGPARELPKRVCKNKPLVYFESLQQNAMHLVKLRLERTPTPEPLPNREERRERRSRRAAEYKQQQEERNQTGEPAGNADNWMEADYSDSDEEKEWTRPSSDGPNREERRERRSRRASEYKQQQAKDPAEEEKSSIRRTTPRKGAAKKSYAEEEEDMVEADATAKDIQGDIYEAETVVDARMNQKGKWEYLVRWKGYDSSADTWEPEGNLGEDLLKVAHKLAGYEEDNQVQEEEDPESDDSEEELIPENADAQGEVYAAETVVDARINQKGKWEYLVRWKGYDASADTWEPEGNLGEDLLKAALQLLDSKGIPHHISANEAEKIVDARMKHRGQWEFLVRWKGCDAFADTWEPEGNLSKGLLQVARKLAYYEEDKLVQAQEDSESNDSEEEAIPEQEKKMAASPTKTVSTANKVTPEKRSAASSSNSFPSDNDDGEFVPSDKEDTTVKSKVTPEKPKLVWIRAKDCTGEHAAFLLEQDEEKMLVKWTSNKKEVWLFKDENVVTNDSERSGRRAAVCNRYGSLANNELQDTEDEEEFEFEPRPKRRLGRKQATHRNAKSNQSDSSDEEQQEPSRPNGDSSEEEEEDVASQPNSHYHLNQEELKDDHFLRYVYCCPVCFVEAYRRLDLNIAAHQQAEDDEVDNHNSDSENEDEDLTISDFQYGPMEVLAKVDPTYQMAGAFCFGQVSSLKHHLQEDHAINVVASETRDLFHRFHLSEADGLVQRHQRLTHNMKGLGYMKNYFDHVAGELKALGEARQQYRHYQRHPNSKHAKEFREQTESFWSSFSIRGHRIWKALVYAYSQSHTSSDEEQQEGDDEEGEEINHDLIYRQKIKAEEDQEEAEDRNYVEDLKRKCGKDEIVGESDDDEEEEDGQNDLVDTDNEDDDDRPIARPRNTRKRDEKKQSRPPQSTEILGCAACGRQKPRPRFSKRQANRKPNNRRCRQCINDGVSIDGDLKVFQPRHGPQGATADNAIDVDDGEGDDASDGEEEKLFSSSVASLEPEDETKVERYVKELANHRKFLDLAPDKVDERLRQLKMENARSIPWFFCWIKRDANSHNGSLRFLLRDNPQHNPIGISAKGFFWGSKYYTRLEMLVDDFKSNQRAGQRDDVLHLSQGSKRKRRRASAFADDDDEED